MVSTWLRSLKGLLQNLSEAMFLLGPSVLDQKHEQAMQDFLHVHHKLSE